MFLKEVRAAPKHEDVLLNALQFYLSFSVCSPLGLLLVTMSVGFLSDSDPPFESLNLAHCRAGIVAQSQVPMLVQVAFPSGGRF